MRHTEQTPRFDVRDQDGDLRKRQVALPKCFDCKQLASERRDQKIALPVIPHLEPNHLYDGFGEQLQYPVWKDSCNKLDRESLYRKRDGNILSWTIFQRRNLD